MTTSVTQAWAALPERAKADAPRQKDAAGEDGFADAVKFGKAGKQPRPQAPTDAAEERRSRFEVRLVAPNQALGAAPRDAAKADSLRQGKIPFDFSQAAVDVEDTGDTGREADTKPAEEQPASDERIVPGEAATPTPFRAHIPPLALLGGYGRTETGPASDAKLPADAEAPTTRSDAGLAMVAPPTAVALAVAPGIPVQASSRIAMRQAGPREPEPLPAAAAPPSSGDAPAVGAE